MKFTYRNNVYNFPTSLSEIKLRDKIEFHKLYGDEIDLKQKNLFSKENENESELSEAELIQHRIEIATKTFSFFSGIPLEEVENNIPIVQIVNIYSVCFAILFEQQEQIDFRQEFLWNNEFWIIQNPELTYQSTITFNEFITSKQIVKQLSELSKGQWESLRYLAAIFLRKENEEFSEKLIEPNAERLELMNDLPMDIAMQVAFFLNISMKIYIKNLVFSEEKETEKGLT